MSKDFASDGPRGGGRRSELAPALRRLRGAGVAIFAFSAAVNILSLTGSIYMLEVYDRVIPGRSIATLTALSLIVLVAFGFLALFDVLRTRILTRVSIDFARAVRARVFRAVVEEPLRSAQLTESLLPMRDVDQIRGFIAGGGPAAFCDLPWLPFYLAICFLCHPLIGAMATLGVVLLSATVLANEWAMRRPMASFGRNVSRRTTVAESAVHNAEVLHAMGMTDRMLARWTEIDDAFLADQRRILDVTGLNGALSKVLRQILQSVMLGSGAWLVISGDATGGIMLASTIMTTRALAPLEQLISHWKGLTGARHSWHRLGEFLARSPLPVRSVALGTPRAHLEVEALTLVPPAARQTVVTDLTFRLEAGSALAVIGPSGSGKSSLSRALAGLWTPVRGSVRLDGAELFRRTAQERGDAVGYLPQDVELFAGTIADNISRFDPDRTDAAVLAAARAAGVHELALRMPQGYETEVGEAGRNLSAGQRQRIALARALYRDPFLVVLDEPNSNLDQEGDHALIEAITGVRRRGGIVVLVAHRPSVLASTDVILVMRDGRATAFGPKDEILPRLYPSAHPAAAQPGHRTTVTGRAGVYSMGASS